MTSDPIHHIRLAELDAGLPDDAEAARQRTRARADPDAAAVLDALAATRAELADHVAPPVPPEIAQRWAVALATAGAARDAPPTPVARRRWTPRPALLAAAVLVVAAVAVGVVQNRPVPAGPSIGQAELAATALTAVGVGDAGEYSDPTRRAGCLRDVAPATVADAPLLGGRTVVLDGRPGVLLVLGTGRLGALRAVVIDPGCHTLLADTPIGR